MLHAEKKHQMMNNEEIIKTLTDYHYVCFNKGKDFVKAYDEAIQIVRQLVSLESEHNAYGNNYDDYWRGVKHSINVLNHRE